MARLRVGTRLLLLALLPVAVLVAVSVIAAIGGWRQANELRDFQAASRASFAAAAVARALSDERAAAVRARLQPSPAARARIGPAQRRTDAAIGRAVARATSEPLPVDAAARLKAVRRRLETPRLQSGAVDEATVADDYSSIVDRVLDLVRALASGAPTTGAGRAANAYLAMLGAIEPARREQLDVAALLTPGGRDRSVGSASRWASLEAARFDDFRSNATGPLKNDLAATVSSRAGMRVTEVRSELLNATRRMRATSLHAWLAASAARISELERIAGEARGALQSAVSRDLGAAVARRSRDLALSLAVLLVVAALALLLRRSITRPLVQLSASARALSAGDLSADVDYGGHDEIGDVVEAFRDLHVTTERLAAEIRAMNAAITCERLDHRADVARFEGTWSQLLGGMNQTMAAFADLQGRRREAELELERVFTLSLDLLCIATFDGYLKRVNPAWERTLGYTEQELLSRSFFEFIHPDDRAETEAAMRALAEGRHAMGIENRYVCRDGSVRWLQWSSRPVPEQGMTYAIARDVTDRKRADAEQAALRRVATLVARAVPPLEVFATVARELRALLEADATRIERRELDGKTTVVASDGEGFGDLAATVYVPIVVEGRDWGATVAAWRRSDQVVRGTDARMAQFTELVATAIVNAESRAQLTASRARAVTAADKTRRRLERQLHDSAQQRLVWLGLQVRTAEAIVPAEQAPLRARLEQIASGLRDVLDELHEISRGLHPAILSKGGIEPALKALARRTAVPVELDVHTPGRLPEHIEVAAYYIVSEALTNAVKHANASLVEVHIEAGDGAITLAIRDDGRGGADPHAGSGLIGLADRVAALSGALEIDSPAGEGTALHVTLPLDAPVL